MKIAIVGSRNLDFKDFKNYVSSDDEIVSGGAKGIDRLAISYAEKNGIKHTVFLPEYNRYGKGAPLVRNKQIVDYSDKVIAFWDGKSKGTLWVIKYAEKTGKPCQVILCTNKSSI